MASVSKPFRIDRPSPWKIIIHVTLLVIGLIAVVWLLKDKSADEGTQIRHEDTPGINESDSPMPGAST